MMIGARTAAWAKSGGGHWLTDFAVDSTTLGEPFSRPGFSLWSDFVRVDPGVNLSVCWDENTGVRPTQNVGLCFFDENYNYLGGTRFNTTTGVRPQAGSYNNQAYVRFCCVTSARETVAYLKQQYASLYYFYQGKPHYPPIRA